MTPELFINTKLTLHERATPVMINSEMIYKLMEEYAEINLQEEKEKYVSSNVIEDILK